MRPNVILALPFLGLLAAAEPEAPPAPHGGPAPAASAAEHRAAAHAPAEAASEAHPAAEAHPATAAQAPGEPAEHAAAGEPPAAHPPGEPPVARADAPPDMHELVAQLNQLNDVIALIQREHADGIDHDLLWNGALKGLAQTLDAHSDYLGKEELALYGAGESAKVFGFGFDWRIDEQGMVQVVRVLPGSPAEAAGLCVHDHLERAADAPLQGVARAMVARAIARCGDRLPLVVRQADGSHLEATLERARLDDPGVGHGEFVDQARGIACVRISRFFAAPPSADGEHESAAGTATASALRAELERLRGDNLHGLILDLRGNGGGNLAAALACAEGFLSPGADGPAVIATQVSHNPQHAAVFTAARSAKRWPSWPVVLLVDGGTASSAEVFAAALQGHRRAVLVGAPTLGKDTVQQVFLLPAGDGLLLTVARLHGPSGRSWANDGLVPDVAVAQDDLARLRLARRAQLVAAGKPLPPELMAARDEPLVRARELLTALVAHGAPRP
jgi:carboxyl-terminal processing protease